MPDTRRKDWERLIAEQASSGQSVPSFCREHGLGKHSFYRWRKRLRENRAVQFALLETKAASDTGAAWPLELMLTNGERLCIGNQVDAARLRRVLEVVRG